MFKELIDNITSIQIEIRNYEKEFLDLLNYIQTNSQQKQDFEINLILSGIKNRVEKVNKNKLYLEKLISINFTLQSKFKDIQLVKFKELIIDIYKENQYLLKYLDADTKYLLNLEVLLDNKDYKGIFKENNEKYINLKIKNNRIILYLNNRIIEYNRINISLKNIPGFNITIKKGILAGIGISIATALTLGLYNPKTEEVHNQELNQISQIKEETINRDINKPKRILDNNKTIILDNNSFKSNKLEFEKDINSKLKEESSDDFNSKFNDEQKKYLLEFEKKFEKDKNIYINKLQTENILDKNNNLKLSYINSRLIPIFTNLAKKEDINLNLVLFMSLIESTFGKQNKSDIGAIGPLQVMPFVMKANCYKFYIYKINKFGKKTGEKNFYSDLFLQIIAGMREIKNIAKQYNIDISYNSKYINKYNLIIISSSYNSGRTNMRNKPYKLIENKETYGHSLKMLALNEVVKKIQ